MIGRIIFSYIINAVAFLAAAYFIPGFNISGNPLAFVVLIAIVTLINLLIRPIIKLVLSPLILVTLGLFNLVINGAILYIIDIYSQNLSIDGLRPLLYATLLIGIINLILGGTRRAYREAF